MSTSLMLWVHVMGNLLWIGSITAVAAALTAEAAGKVEGKVALLIYRRLAVPGFLASFAGGLAMLAMNPALYFVQTRWMHPKLTLALAVIALHHIIGARAKKVAGGTVTGPGKAGLLSAILLACAAASAFLALAKPF